MHKLIFPLLVVALLFLTASPASADATLRVYYAGAEGSVTTALDLAGFSRVDDPAQADVLVLNGVVPDPATAAAQVERGAGLVLILGPSLSAADVQTVTGIPVTLTPRDDPVSLVELDVDDSLTRDVVWNGAPQVRDRFQVETPLSSVQPLVTAYETGEWILWQARPGVYVFNVFLDDVNPQIQEWAYYNYFLYHLSCAPPDGRRSPLPITPPRPYRTSASAISCSS
jgi:hypothetical protein